MLGALQPHLNEDSFRPAIKADAHDQVDRFCSLLERHIRTEERQLFVLAENRMNPTEMAELGRQIKAHLL